MSESTGKSGSAMGRILMLVLGLGFLGLMVDIKVEHVEVVREDWVGWIPIVYSGLMALACFIAMANWKPKTRLVMMVLFAVGFIVGGVGFYEHNHGNFTKVTSNMVSAWTNSEMNHPHGPPQTAPLAFAGLGLLGVVACAKKLN